MFLKFDHQNASFKDLISQFSIYVVLLMMMVLTSICHQHVLQLAESYDSKYGGFGSAPKFPRPVEMQLMLYDSKRSGETGNSGEAKNALKMVLFTLECMARGGIHDHVGGGFHRYSVDECWHGELILYLSVLILILNPILLFNL